MAKQGTSIEKLYFSLGLDISELSTDFIAAEQTVNQNLAKLNRESNLVKLRMQVETAGLDPIKDASKILEIQSRSLNEQLQIQKDRLNILTATWQSYVKQQGETSTAAQRAEKQMLQERLAIQELEKEIQQLSKVQDQANKNKNNTLLTNYTAAKDKVTNSLNTVTSAFNDLKAASSSTGTAIDKAVEVIARLPHPALKVAAAIVAIPVAIHAMETELINLAKPAIKAGDAIYKLSQRMGTTVKDASEFNTTIKMMGLDTINILSTMDRLTRQVLTAPKEGNTITKAFKAFGVELRNADGSLKSYHDRMLALAAGLRKAKEAGQLTEFQTLLGRNGLGDMASAAQDYEAVWEKAQKRLVKSGLANPKLAHELNIELNLLDAQMGQLKTAFSNAMMPVAAELIPEVQAKFARLTQFIKDNKDTIREWGDIAAKIVIKLGDAAETVGSAIGSLIESIGKDNKLRFDAVVNDENIKTFEDYKNYRESFVDPDLKPLRDYLLETSPEAQKRLDKNYRDVWEKILKKRAEIQAELDAANAAGKSESQLTDKEKALLDEAQLESIKRATKNQIELAELKYKAEHNAVENEIYDIQRWEKEQLNAIGNVKDAEQESLSIRELAEFKISQIREIATKESQQRAREYLREAQELSADSATTAYKRELQKIDEWKEKMKEKAYLAEEVAAIEENAAAKAAKAYKDQVNSIKNAMKSFEDEIYSLTHSQYENDLKKALEQYQEGLKQGLDKGTLDTWLRLKVSDIDANAAKRGKEYKGRDNKPSYIVEWGKNKGPKEDNVLGQIQQILSGTAKDMQKGFQVLYGNALQNSYSASSPSIIEFGSDKLVKSNEKLANVNAELTDTIEAASFTAPKAKTEEQQPITNNINITVQVDNVNANNQELVDEATVKIANGVKSAFNQTSSNFGYGR